jgi:hypothetical protein
MFTTAGNERSLITISTLTYFLVAIIYVMKIGASPSGDEPHYLLISETLIKYHSFDVMRAYEHKDYLSFYPNTLDPHVVSVQGRIVSKHQMGGPALWLIPFLLFGRLGAIWFIGTVCVLIVLNIYRLLLAMEIRQPIAFDVSLALALASPLCIYAHLTFVEPIGALVCVYVLRKFIESDVSLSALLLSSILLGLLPWVNVRFVLIEVPLFLMILWRLYQHARLRNMFSYIAYLLPIALLTAGLEVFTWQLMGSLNPAIAMATDQQALHQNVLLSPFAPLFGLLFDQDAGLLICFPLSAFLVAGLLLSVKKRYLTYSLAILFTSIPYMIAICTYIGWHGGWCPPARYILVLLPAWSFYLACVLQEVNGCFVKLFVHVTFWWGVIYNLLSLLPSTNGFNDPMEPNNVLDFLYIGNIHLTDFWSSVPSAQFDWNAAQSYHLISVGNGIWVAAYLLLTVFLMHQARSNRDEPTKVDHTIDPSREILRAR